MALFMFEKYNDEARRTIFYARYEASEFGADSISPEHFLLGLLRYKDGSLSKLLPATVTAEDVRRRVEASGAVREKLSVSVELPLSAEMKKVLAFAYEESEELSHRHIGPEHLLLGLLRAGRTPAETILREHGVGLFATREKVGAMSPAAASSGRAGRSRIVPDGPELPLRVEHIGIATRSIAEALGFWRDALGLEVKHTETVEEQGVNVAMLPAGEPRIELLEPTGPDSPVAKFLEKRGPGIHHVAVRVADIRAALARLKAEGARLIDEEPRAGAGGCLVAFVHPSASGGVLLELVQHTAGESGHQTKER
jgi:methylmalonyl-CoA/ethylmalonyl-CoA epimerase